MESKAFPATDDQQGPSEYYQDDNTWDIDISSMEPFQQVALTDAARQIRLLTVLPGEPHEIIRVRLSTHWIHGEDDDENQCEDDQPFDNGHEGDGDQLDDQNDELGTDGVDEDELDREYGYDDNDYDDDDDDDDTGDDGSGTADSNSGFDPLDRYARFSGVPPYFAISYTWGDLRTRLIFIDDQPFYARKNCEYALWQFRLHFPMELVWIDSICINQSNNSEKSHQILKMWDIYRNSRKVLACVGPHADDSELIVDAAKDLQALGVASSGKSHDTYVVDSIPWAISRGKRYVDDLGKSLEMFSRRVYWSRLWILQEVVASEGSKRLIILCGHDAIPWADLLAVEYTLADDIPYHEAQIQWEPDASELLLTSRCFISVWSFMDERRFHPVKVLRSAFDFDCHDPKDRLYGLLALIQWPQDFPSVVPDYGKSSWDLLVEMLPIIPLSLFDAAIGAFMPTCGPIETEALPRRWTRVDFARSLDSSHGLLSSQSEYHGAGHLAEIPCLDHGNALDAIARPEGLHRGKDTADSGEIQLATTLGAELLSSDYRLYFDTNVETDVEDGLKTVMSYRNDSTNDGIRAIASSLSSVHWETPKVLVVDSKAVALLDHRTLPGDVLLSFWDPFLLVVRQQSGGIYDVVGQAVVLSDGGSNGDHRTRAIDNLFTSLSNGSQMSKATGKIALSAEDKVVLDSLRTALTQEYSYNHGLGLLCLTTTLIAEPKGAISLELQPCEVQYDEKGQLQLL